MAEDSHVGVDGRYGCLAKGIDQIGAIEQCDSRSHCITASSDTMKHFMHRVVLLPNDA